MNRKSRRASAKEKNNSPSASSGHANALKHRKLGENFVRSGNLEKAKPCFQQAIALDPSDATSHSNLAFVLAQMGEIDEAMKGYERALEITPDNPSMQTNLGKLRGGSGRFEEAMKCYEHAIAAKPDHIEALYQMGRALKKLNRPKEAAKYFTRAFRVTWRASLVKDSWDGRILMTLGESLMSVRCTKDALKCFRRAAEVNPKAVGTHYQSGVAHSQLGQFKRAVPCFRRAIEMDSQIFQFHKNLELALMQLGQYEDAALSLKTALEIRPEDHSVRHFLGAVSSHPSDKASLNKYVEDLFDDYAETFDDHLVNVLNYRVPELLRLAIGHEGDAEEAVWNVIDLGCGTGLCGLLFRDLADKLVGVDLSSAMLDQARKRDVYDELLQTDVTEALAHATELYDLVIAADVMIYVGDLAPLFEACARALRSGGRFAFTIESTDRNSYFIDSSGRYRHSPEYIRNLATDHHFQIDRSEEIAIRKEFGKAVEGHLFVLSK
jgi:predicted TPR repeat methyltransferase